MCGNTGWFPGYPLFIKIISYVITDITVAGVVLSKTFYFLSLLIIMLIVKIKDISTQNVIYLLLPAFSFGFIYYNAIFPISTVLFFSLLAICLFLKKRLLLTGLCCFIVSFLYPTGFLLSFAFALTIFIKEIKSGQIRKLRKCLIPLFFGGIGVIATFLVYYFQVDDWTAFIQVQSKYGHGLHSPIKSVGIMLKNISFNSLSLKDMTTLQSVLVIIGYLLLSFFFFIKKLYRTELFLLSYLYTSLFLIFPWVVGGNLSMYRAESLLLPFVFLLKDIKIQWTILILAILVGIGGVMSYLFFTSVLV